VPQIEDRQLHDVVEILFGIGIQRFIGVQRLEPVALAGDAAQPFMCLPSAIHFLCQITSALMAAGLELRGKGAAIARTSPGFIAAIATASSDDGH